MKELYEFNAFSLRQKLLNQEITPKTLSEALCERIRAIDPIVGAWAYMDDDVIQKQLDKIALQNPHENPLWGIPIGVKDIYNTFDMPTEMGSAIWKDFTPGNDARMVHYLRRSGALMLGKTVTAEFAVHHQEQTRNPHDLSRTPGTSSSGSAAAVAAGMVPIALGSQTAGSIGKPASFCGVYGYKASFGVLPRIGVLKTTDTLDTLGFFTRSVDDLEMVFNASRVHGTNYEFVHQYIDQYVHDPKKPIRVGVITHPQWKFAGENEKKAFHAWSQSINIENVTIEAIDFPEFLTSVYELHTTIYDKALSYYFKDEMGYKEQMSERFRKMIEHGDTIDPSLYFHAINEQALLTRAFNQWMEPYDVLLTLGTAGEAPYGLHCEELPDSNLIWTFLGLPTLMMPVLKGGNNLPVGVLAIAKKYQDLLLIDFSKLLKKSGYIDDIKPITPKQ
ncbi:MAG: amidase [Sulfuricurvum sp.]|nr:amidase [Sulfuricurvum sp.]